MRKLNNDGYEQKILTANENNKILLTKYLRKRISHVDLTTEAKLEQLFYASSMILILN